MTVQSSRHLRVIAMDTIDLSFRHLEKMVPPPQNTETIAGKMQRYREKLPEQALILKMARYCSGLKAINVLNNAGFYQEQSVIQRTLDEIGEDIVFICLGIDSGNLSNDQKTYLDFFWSEEFNHPDVMKSTLRRGMVPRKKIRAYINRAQSLRDPSTADTALRAIHSAYSGYVHASSPQIMDMYRGDPPSFEIAGSKDFYLNISHSEDAWNYYFRGLLTVAHIAVVFKRKDLVSFLYNKIHEFEKISVRL